MAARRVLIAILAFVGGISIVAALVPVGPASDDEESTTSTTESEARRPAAPRTDPDGELIRESVRPKPGAGKPQRIDAELGDQLELLVYSPTGVQVEVTRIGATGFAASEAPARFDFRLSDTGMYLVKPLEGGEPLATIRVRDPAEPGSKDGGANAGAGGRRDGGDPPSQDLGGVMQPAVEPS